MTVTDHGSLSLQQACRCRAVDLIRACPFGKGQRVRREGICVTQALPFIDALHQELAPLGIVRGNNEGGGGPDMIPLQRLGMPVLRLNQNGEDYFHFHHTPNDTFDKKIGRAHV